jgi:hypothetical protein
LGEIIGVRVVLLGSALGELGAVAWLIWSPILHDRVLPAQDHCAPTGHPIQPSVSQLDKNSSTSYNSTYDESTGA